MKSQVDLVITTKYVSFINISFTVIVTLKLHYRLKIRVAKLHHVQKKKNETIAISREAS